MKLVNTFLSIVIMATVFLAMASSSMASSTSGMDRGEDKPFKPIIGMVDLPSGGNSWRRFLNFRP
ncbi:MAG: hypothetical protein HOM34_07145 [Planctomycetes bacterium]|jgi:hypothetical protein|nr:hypothetical protein [Planctomycetota bacterium]MBT4029775.1 hypothetical protein [Planctomycetota bacterium]MBT4559834.1 hypothetical protein [Planctomycetota bacterium]MBT5102388.1 hypothetical protein [Planctomycetota bacterium]MBT5120479.1 hypothetical protein [Planctomycetota bacterium]